MDGFENTLKRWRKLKISVLTVSLMLATTYFYLINQVEFLEQRFGETRLLGHIGIVLSPFAVPDLISLFKEIFILFCLMSFFESRRGSVFYLPDLFVKSTLINTFSVVIFWFLKIFRDQPGFGPYLELQTRLPIRGFVFVCALELFNGIFYLLGSQMARGGQRLKLLSALIVFFCFFWALFLRLPFFCALLVGVLCRSRLNPIDQLFLNELLVKIDKRFQWGSRLLFLRSPGLEWWEKGPEPISEQNKLDKTFDTRTEDKFEDEVSRSCHDEVDVQKYIQPSLEMDKTKEMDSFEI